jgi:hypothetical protein
MTAMDKRPLISESVMVIRIGVYLTGEELDQHVVRVTPGVSRTTTVRKVPTKLKSGLPAIVRPDRHPGASFSLH